MTQLDLYKGKIKDIISDPALIDNIDSFRKNSLLEGIGLICPPLGSLLQINSNFLSDKNISEIKNDISYLTNALEKIKDYNKEFVESREFRPFVEEIMKNIIYSENEYKKRLFVNLLSNSLLKTDPIEIKLIYSKTLQDLTPLHMEFLVFLADPISFCKFKNRWPTAIAGRGPLKDIIYALFSEHPKHIINQTFLDLGRYGIINEEFSKLNNRFNTIDMDYTRIYKNPEENPIIIEILKPVLNSFTEYGNNFIAYLKDPIKL